MTSEGSQIHNNSSRCIRPPWDGSTESELHEVATALSSERLARLRGPDILRDPYLNKGSAFTERERDLLNLKGLLPPLVLTIEEQLFKTKNQFDQQATDIAKYTFLEELHNRNETLYYRFLLENVKQTLPIVYTPTVGQACQDFSDMYRTYARGLFLSKDKGEFRAMCRNWPQHDVDIIVITDGSRILGLGDLGINGMGIPIGKLALYVAAAGFQPWRTLPITVDVGTNNEKYRNSSTYIGLKDDRPDDDEFYDVMDKAIEAIQWRWPNALIQFEDFSNAHAFGLLEKYRNKILCFNDDIQGTAATVLAGLLAALMIQQSDPSNAPLKLSEQRIVFLGAGSAGVGVADLIAQGMAIEAMREDPATEIDAQYFRTRNFWLVDSKGVVTKNRGDVLQAHKVRFARDDDTIPDLYSTVEKVKPTILLGLAGRPAGLFTEAIIKTMDKDCTKSGLRPIIMALSNPTSKSECTAEQAYQWSGGRAIFASGSPFDPVTINGKKNVPGQGNNMYIFPGVGYGAVMCRSKSITDSMFYAAAKELSLQVTREDLNNGSVYPDLRNIRDITAKIAAGVCKVAIEEGLSSGCCGRRSCDLDEMVTVLAGKMWWPQYEDYV